MSESLKKCPWCGNKPQLIVENLTGGDTGYAYCCNGERIDGHYVETAWYESEEYARNAWNKRLC